MLVPTVVNYCKRNGSEFRMKLNRITDWMYHWNLTLKYVFLRKRLFWFQLQRWLGLHENCKSSKLDSKYFRQRLRRPWIANGVKCISVIKTHGHKVSVVFCYFTYIYQKVFELSPTEINIRNALPYAETAGITQIFCKLFYVHRNAGKAFPIVSRGLRVKCICFLVRIAWGSEGWTSLHPQKSSTCSLWSTTATLRWFQLSCLSPWWLSSVVWDPDLSSAGYSAQGNGAPFYPLTRASST